MADGHRPPAASGTRRACPRALPAPRVIAVVVTYNRRQLLLEALAAVHAQSRAPDDVIVVDNASTDETAAAVRSQFPDARWPRWRATPAAPAGSPTAWRWPWPAPRT